VEALVRWNHPTMGVLGPMAFLDLSEDAGLDLPLGDAVLHSACRAVADIPTPLRLGINLSIAQLTDRGLAERMRSILDQYALSPERLTVEITERDTLARRAGAGRAAPERTLMELREMGASLALDDFGTGYSSLTHIRRYTLRSLKIDHTFVSGVCTHHEDRAVVAAVVGMAGALGLTVVAEGVETDEQYELLREMGCTMAQGFLVARPMPGDALRSWVAARGADWHEGNLAPADALSVPV
jgi:EAL domain-containing protein (putative c-di-GMP-specific phosphodiesterase class I)